MKKLLDEIEENMQTIWNKAYGDEINQDINLVVEMYDDLLNEWDEMFHYSSFWYEGYKMICEGLGDAIFMFDTDGPEQNDLVDRLLELVSENPDDRIVKELISKIKLKELEEDFK